jgi:hypothetical protein
VHTNQQSYSTYDPHGYEPLFVDENCLNSEDCRQAIVEAIAKPRDWRSFLTSKELIELEKALKDSEKSKSPYFYCPGEWAETRERRSAAAQLGTFRAFARDKCNQGQRFWYGDVPPWVQSGGSR